MAIRVEAPNLQAAMAQGAMQASDAGLVQELVGLPATFLSRA